MLCNLFSRQIFISVVMLFRNFDVCFCVLEFLFIFCMCVCKYSIDFVCTHCSFVPINIFNH